MAKFIVYETTEIRTNHVVEASSATAAVNKVKRQPGVPNTYHSLEQHFRTKEIKEENINE